MSSGESAAVGDTVSPFLTRLLITAGLNAGLDRLQVAGIPGVAVAQQEDGIRFATRAHLRVWEAIWGPVWEAGGAARLIELWRPGSLGVWDYLFTATGSLTDALRVGARHSSAFANLDDEFEVVTDSDGSATFEWRTAYDGLEVISAIEEFVPALVLAEASRGARRRLIPQSVKLTGSAPPRHDHLIDLYGTDRIEFGAATTSITFAEADAEAPLPGADPALAAVLADYARITVATARPFLGWLDKFRAVLEKTIATGPPDLPRVAHELAYSPRTLQRRLHDEGTSWRRELEVLRHGRVDHLLRETSLSIDSIATRVGYTDPRALRRAIHRWYGHGPATVRKAALAGQGATVRRR